MCAKLYSDLPRNRTVEIAPGVAMDFVLVLPGVFVMGDKNGAKWTGEKAEHLVRITRPFYLGRYPIIQAQWKAVMGTNPAEYLGDLWRPVEKANWCDITGQCENESQDDGFLNRLSSPAGSLFRLPTEAEWEYAAKGGHLAPQEIESKAAATVYSTYAGGEDASAAAWLGENNDYSTLRIGYRQPNCLGLYGMSGNVFEWCQDTFDEQCYEKRSENGQEVTNPVADVSGRYRVVRGGSWLDNSMTGSSAYRYIGRPAYRYRNYGLRLVLASSLG